MTARAFSLLLQDIRDGRTHSELTNGMDELLQAVRNTGKAGTITLEIKIKPASRGDDFFWVTDDNDLSRNHPRQQHLDLRTATSAAPVSLKEASK